MQNCEKRILVSSNLQPVLSMSLSLSCLQNPEPYQMNSCRLANLKIHYIQFCFKQNAPNAAMRYCAPSEINIIQHNGMAAIKIHLKLVSLTAFRDCIFWWILFRGWNLLKNERALGKEGVFGLSQWDGVLRNVIGSVFF